MKHVYEVDVVRSGQPRPYADSEYEYVVRFIVITGSGPNGDTPIPRRGVTKERAEKVASTLCGFLLAGDPKANWSSNMMTSCREEGEGVWRFTSTAAYTG